jgi:hypothetical protein
MCATQGQLSPSGCPIYSPLAFQVIVLRVVLMTMCMLLILNRLPYAPIVLAATISTILNKWTGGTAPCICIRQITNSVDPTPGVHILPLTHTT